MVNLTVGGSLDSIVSSSRVRRAHTFFPALQLHVGRRLQYGLHWKRCLYFVILLPISAPGILYYSSCCPSIQHIAPLVRPA